MAINVINKTFGFITAESETLTTPQTFYTVPTGANFLLKTIKIVDVGGSGGEVLFKAKGYYFEDVTVGEYDSIDCSPMTPYAFEGDTQLQYQSCGGAGIHILITGVLQQTT
jgi:hypothetical protein